MLLVRHKGLNAWLPIGGEIEHGERPLEAAIRETKEETGLTLTPEDFPLTDDLTGRQRGFIAYEEHSAGPKGLHMNFVFMARTPSTQIELSGEHSDYQWRTASEWFNSEILLPNVVDNLMEVETHRDKIRAALQG